jgi:hypothetical protein
MQIEVMSLLSLPVRMTDRTGLFNTPIFLLNLGCKVTPPGKLFTLTCSGKFSLPCADFGKRKARFATIPIKGSFLVKTSVKSCFIPNAFYVPGYHVHLTEVSIKIAENFKNYIP